MASQAPSPNSSPSGVTPNSTNTSPPPTLSTSSPPLSSPDNNSTNSSPPLSSSDNNSTNSSPPLSSSDNNSTNSSPPLSSSDNNSTNSSPPPMSQPNATSNPQPPSSPSSNSSSPPPQSPPPAVPSAPPPVSVSLSPPPPTPTPVTPASEPPTSTPALPPPPTTTPVLNPPPPVTQPPVVSPPPPPVQSSPPPSTRPSPPPPTRSSPPPPTRSSPPPPTRSSPPPPNRSPPPVSSPPPAVTSPPPQEVSPPPPPSTAVPPPADSPPPLPSSSPSPPAENPPESSPAPPELTPPPPSISDPTLPPSNSPPTTSSPPVNQTRPTPSPPLLPSQPPTVTPGNNSNTGGTSLGPTPFIPNPPVPTQPNATIVPSSGGNANSTSSGGGVSTGGAVAIGLIVGFVVLSLIGMGVWFLRKKKKQVTGYHAGHVMPSPLGSSPVSDSSHTKAYSSAPLIRHRSGSDIIYSPQDSGILGNSRSWFTYEELKELTNGFSEQNLLGEGGFGCVYKGIMADGREVAVKQLKIGGSQGEREFSAEVETISRVHHRHLVSLVGYCISEHQRLLVYDFVPNNTLYYHLHGEGRPVMDWATRVKVATGAARGISYLHEDCHPRIIHRDIKSSNILLDNNYDAQVSDFGLAKLALDAYTHITTRVMGTFGYMAPEYASSGKLTEKSDVYSFGVVLLELISGRKPVDTSQPMGEESLVEWARPLMSDALENQELEGLIDPRLQKNYVETEMFRMIEAAAACVRHSAGKRPRMGQVLRALDAIGDSTDLTNGIRPGQSEVFNSAQQSAEIRLFQRMAFGSQNYSSDMFSQSSWGS